MCNKKVNQWVSIFVHVLGQGKVNYPIKALWYYVLAYLPLNFLRACISDSFESFWMKKMRKKYLLRICRNKIRYPFTLWNSYSTTYPKTHTRHLVKEIMTKHLWQMKMMKWVFIYIIYFSPSVRYYHFKIRIYSFCYIGHKKDICNLHIYVINFSIW